MKPEFSIDDIDSGWSWIVATSCSFLYLIYWGINSVTGQLFVATFHTYPVTRDVASLPYSVGVAVCHLIGPLAGYFGHNFGLRRTMIIGSVVGGIGIAACFTATSVAWITAFYGILFGTGFCIANCLSHVCIMKCFIKHRAVATALTFTGASLGNLLLPPLVDVLLIEYGLNGTFLILSGLVLNCIPAAMLIKNPRRNYIVTRKNPLDCHGNGNINSNGVSNPISGNQCSVIPEENGKVYSKAKEGCDNPCLSSTSERYETKSTKIVYQTDVQINDVPKVIVPEDYETMNVYENGLQSTVSVNCEEEHNKTIDNACDNPQDTGIDNEEIEGSLTPKYSSKTTNVPSDISKSHQFIDMSVAVNKTEILDQSPCVPDSFSSPDDPSSQNSIKSNGKVKVKSDFSLSKTIKLLVSNKMYILVVISSISFKYTSIGLMNTIIIDYAMDLGIEPTVSKYALMSAAFEIFGCLGFGKMSDIKLMRNSDILVLGFIVQSAAASTMVYASKLWHLVVLMVIYNIAGGICIFFPVLIAHYVPEKFITIAIPCTQVFSAPISVLVSPTIGYFRENSGSYTGVLYLVAGLCISCSAPWLYVSWLERQENNKVKPKE